MLPNTKRGWIIPGVILILFIGVAGYSRNSPVVHKAIVAVIEPKYNQMVEEGEALLDEVWDDTANDLRPKSLAERQQYLAKYRADIESDTEDPELNEMVINNFIREMNDRGVYFELAKTEKFIKATVKTEEYLEPV